MKRAAHRSSSAQHRLLVPAQLERLIDALGYGIELESHLAGIQVG